MRTPRSRHQVLCAWWPRTASMAGVRWYGRLVLLAGGLGVLSLLWPAALATYAAAATAAEGGPSQSMAAGLEAFRRGDIEGAATHWQAAARVYAETQQAQAHSVVLTYLAHAYAGLGHYSQATNSLHTALRLTESTADRVQRARILGALGDIALASGDIVAAEQQVREALALASELDNAELVATLLHTRGNLLMAQQQWPAALESYQASAQSAQQAHQFGMAGRALAHAALAAEREHQTPRARALLDEGLTALRQAEPSHDTAYDFLLIGEAYHRLADADHALVLRAAAILQEAAGLAQTLQDVRALSYAWGYLGRLYEAAHRHQEALQLTRQAALAAQQVHAPESLYLWQWQTGRLLHALGDLPAALEAYGRAIATVQTMRPELLRSSGQVPASFRAAIGPLYFELAALFLRHAAALETQDQGVLSPQYAQALQQARATIEQFKTAELRAYFGDECVDAARPRSTALEHVSADTVIVYPILLPDRTELLVSLPSGLKRIVVPVNGPDLEQSVTILRNAVEDRDSLRYLQHAQRLYTWLIRPLEADLAAWPIQTIVMVPDGALRLLPLAALHDGQRFLIEKYALAVTPSLTLTEPQPLARDKPQVLAVGLSGAFAGFPALPGVSEELHSIQQLYGGQVLLDKAFSPASLEHTIQQGQFGIVHIATHGHFAAEADQSFLLTAQGKLTLPHLAKIVGRLRFRTQPLELLTLSACDTAQGDDRAALGLAGVAIQAGARSALATLWGTPDDAAAVLMRIFYQQLHTPGVSRARALQQAQVHLLQQPQYAEPLFWAAFLLINDWS